MKKPLISVIMGSYNPVSRQVLESAVNSIIEQSCQDWEFIICDDGSDIPYAEYLSKLSRMDSRIILIRNEKNMGLGYSLNRCLDMASGDFIARMDDDDISLPNRFSKEIEFLKANPEYAWVASNAALFDEKGVWGEGSRVEIPEENDYLKYSPFIHPSVMFRKNALTAVGGYSEEKRTLRCEDYELFMRMHAKSLRGYNLQEILLEYREASESYAKKAFKYYYYESQVRRAGFKQMGIGFIKRTPYVLKPLVLAALSVNTGFTQSLRNARSTDNHAIKIIESRRDRKHTKKYRNNLEHCHNALFLKPLTGKDAELSENFLSRTDMLVFAPVMNAYIIWVLRNACEMGIERLYFLARDAYTMYETARKYCEKFKLPIECRYLYCSRYSLRKPLYHKNIEAALEHVCRGGIEVTLRKILIRSGFTAEDIEAYSKTTNEKLDLIIPHSMLSEYKQRLKSDEEYLKLLKMRSELAWPDMTAYLRQEGMFDNKSMALVDSGWTGTTQQTFNDILSACGIKNKFKGFYFGMYECPKKSTRSDYLSFYFSPEKGLKNKVFFSNCLFEGVFSAPHGMTVSYKHDGKKMIPCFLKANESTRKHMERVAKNLSTYTELLLNNLSEERFYKLSFKFLRKMCYKQLKNFMWCPGDMEANEYGKIQFSDDLLDDHMQDIAARLSNKELRENHVLFKLLFMSGMRKGHVRESAWYEASAVKYSRFSFWHRINYAFYKALLYIRNGIKS